MKAHPLNGKMKVYLKQNQLIFFFISKIRDFFLLSNIHGQELFLSTKKTNSLKHFSKNAMADI